jgi:hypothetical protein
MSAALDYLKASGAISISIIEIDAFRVGHKIDPAAALIVWLLETIASAVVKYTRHDAGKSAVRPLRSKRCTVLPQLNALC